MKLMQELMKSETVETVVESGQKNSVEYAKFMRVMDLLEKELDHIRAVLKDGSQFRKLATSLGGDDGFAKGANEALKKLENEIMDLHMSVGTSQQESENE